MPVVKSIANMLARAGPIIKRLPHNAVMVEVGVSTALLAEHLLRTRQDLQWYGVDPWVGRGSCRPAYVATGDVHAALSAAEAVEHMKMARARLQPFGERAVVLREWSPQAADLFFELGIVDQVFLDGDHSREGVLFDCRGWWPVLKHGGWLGGHDINHTDPRFRFGVTEAVEEFSREVGVPYELDGGLTFWMRKPS